MDFPILDLMNQGGCYHKLLDLLHPGGLARVLARLLRHLDVNTLFRGEQGLRINRDDSDLTPAAMPGEEGKPVAVFLDQLQPLEPPGEIHEATGVALYVERRDLAGFDHRAIGGYGGDDRRALWGVGVFDHGNVLEPARQRFEVDLRISGGEVESHVPVDPEVLGVTSDADLGRIFAEPPGPFLKTGPTA